MNVINVTNHNIDMLFCLDVEPNMCFNNYNCRECIFGHIITFPPSGTTISATPIEKHYKDEANVELITLDFVPSLESQTELQKIKREMEMKDDGYYVIIGSIIAAQAFPEEVYAMVPVPTFERAARDKKLVRSDKFTVFPIKEGR